MRVVNSVHRCLENVNLCHLCNHVRDCNDMEGETVESSREMDQERLGRGDGGGEQREGVRVHLDVGDRFEWDDLFQREVWE